MGYNYEVIERNEKCKNNMLNKIFKTNEGYDILITEYINRHKVKIKFLDEYGYERYSTSQNIKNGEIKNPYNKTVYDIGFYGDGDYTARANNKKTLHYIKWFSMFNRCYDEKYHEKQPKYKDCEVSKEFHCFQDFAKWMDENWYDYPQMLELDKDLLVEGNKVYSPNTCCFIPKEVNNAINYKRYDKQHMSKIYNKYKDILPRNITEKLYELTI